MEHFQTDIGISNRELTTKGHTDRFTLGRVLIVGLFLLCFNRQLAGQTSNAPLTVTTIRQTPLQVLDSGKTNTLTNIPSGTNLNVLQTQSGWYLVVDPASGRKGWIDGKNTKRDTNQQPKNSTPITIPSFPSNRFITVQKDVPVYVGKERIGQIDKHKILWVFGHKDGWFWVKLPGSPKRGWVESKYLAVRNMEPIFQKRQETLATQTATEVRNLSRKKEFAKALAKARESVELHIPLYGEEHPYTIQENVVVGWLMIKTGLVDSGRKYISHWVKIQEGLQGVDSPDLIPTYRFAGRFGLDVSNDFARSFYDKIFRIIDKQFAGDLKQRTTKRSEEIALLNQSRATEIALEYALKNHAQLKVTNLKDTDLEALELLNIAALYQSLSKLNQAEEFYKRALAIPESKITRQLRGNIHSQLGEHYQQRSINELADENYELAVKCFRDGYGDQHAITAKALFEYGWNKYFLTDYAGAIDQLHESLSAYESMSSTNPLRIAGVKTQLGYVYTMSGSVSKGISQFRSAVNIAESAGHKDSLAAASFYQALGFGLDIIGDPEAEKYLRKSVQMYESGKTPETRTKAESFRRYASFLLYRGKYDDAEQYFLKARAITSKYPNLDGYDAMNLNALASIAEYRKNYSQAKDLAQQALQKLLDTHEDDHQSVLQVRSRLAHIQMLEGNKRGAEAAYSTLAPLVKKKLGPHPDSIKTYTRLAESTSSASAIDHLAEARRLAFLYVNEELPQLPPHQQLSFLNQRYKSDFDAAIRLGISIDESARNVERAFEWLVNGKAVSHEALGRYYRTARRKPVSRTQEWRDIADLQKRLKANSVYVDVIKIAFRDSRINERRFHYIAFVATREGLKSVDLGRADVIDQEIALARKTIIETAASIAEEGEEVATRDCNVVLARLRKAIWDKLEIGENVEHVTICPDSNLWLLPWSALPFEDEKKTLIERCNVTFVVSGRDLFTERKDDSVSQSAIFADPNFGTRTDSLTRSSQQNSKYRRFAPVKQLRFAGFEAKNIAPLLRQIDQQDPIQFVQDRATEQNVKTIKSPRHLLLATHGLFLGDVSNSTDTDSASNELRGLSSTDEIDTSSFRKLANPLENSGLLLAGFNQSSDPQNDCVLTGREIVEMDLIGTQLIVLSACDTAVGELNNGEGVAGLRQAFQLAGARNVLATLWSVDDEQTARTMIEFFRNLSSTKDVDFSKALRQSLVNRIQFRRARYGAAHPFFWAAFTLTGQD